MSAHSFSRILYASRTQARFAGGRVPLRSVICHIFCLFFFGEFIILKKDPYVQTTKKTPRSGKATGTNRGECTPPPSNSGRGPDSGTEAESCGISPLPRVVCSKTVTMVL